jgi:hypothetical protein
VLDDSFVGSFLSVSCDSAVESCPGVFDESSCDFFSGSCVSPPSVVLCGFGVLGDSGLFSGGFSSFSSGEALVLV